MRAQWAGLRIHEAHARVVSLPRLSPQIVGQLVLLLFIAHQRRLRDVLLVFLDSLHHRHLLLGVKVEVSLRRDLSESRLCPGRRHQIQGDPPIAMMINRVACKDPPANTESQSTMRDEFLRLRQAGHHLTYDIADGPPSSCHHEFRSISIPGNAR